VIYLFVEHDFVIEEENISSLWRNRRKDLTVLRERKKIQDDDVATKRQKTDNGTEEDDDHVGTAEKTDTGKQCERLSSEGKDGKNSTDEVRNSIQTSVLFLLLFIECIVSTY